jgi:crotonobetainyl-CoA:carnitine CoA-transferase CaiB-like acyl-CoA transferase
LSATPPDYRIPPPVLGEHTEDILRGELGLSEDRLSALRKAGVI